MKKSYLFCLALLCISITLLVWGMQSPESQEQEEFTLFNEPNPLKAQAARQVLFKWKDSPESVRSDWDKLPRDLKQTLLQLVNQPIDSAGRTILYYAKTPEDINFLFTNLKANLEHTDYFGYKPLQFMTMTKPGNVQKLIELGAKINPSPPSDLDMIHRFTIQGLNEPIKKLLATGVQVDLQVPGTDMTPLMLAAHANKGPTVELLEKNGANVNAVNFVGNTALMAAVQSGNPAIVRYLLAKGAQVNHGNNSGRTALIAAVKKNHMPIINILLSNGANIDQIDGKNKTALMHAIELGRIQVAELLIDKGARNGNTALIKAARRGLTSIVHKLLQADANIEILKTGRETALIIAHKKYNLASEKAKQEKNPKKKKQYEAIKNNFNKIIMILQSRPTSKN